MGHPYQKEFTKFGVFWNCIVLSVFIYCCFPQGHVNLSLIDYIGEKIVNNPQILEECRPSSFLSLVSGMANAEYKPAGWDCIQEALMRNTTLIRKVGETVAITYRNSCSNCIVQFVLSIIHIWLGVVCSLCSLTFLYKPLNWTAQHLPLFGKRIACTFLARSLCT